MSSYCCNFTASTNWCFKSIFRHSGLRSTFTDLGDGTVMHCWVPKKRKPNRPDVLLIHGFGSNAMWQWLRTIPNLSPHFNVYVPDLLFFGDSVTTRKERTDAFQAQCVKKVMEANSVEKVAVVGLSYGGFVAYSMAHQFKDFVEKVVICCAGVAAEEDDLQGELFPVKDIEEAADILVPQSPEKVRELLGYVFIKPPKPLPKCLLHDIIDEMFIQHVEERRDLLRTIAKDRRFSDLPKITQPTLIVWGDQDRIFPLELGERLKRHLGDTSQLVVIKNSGHGFICEKSKKFHKHLKSFLLKSVSNSTIKNEDQIEKKVEENGKHHQQIALPNITLVEQQLTAKSS